MAISEDLRIARHESAHAIAALELRCFVDKIDLDAQNSPCGLGASYVRIPDPEQFTGEARIKAINICLIVNCAGAANDAVELGISLSDAWKKQDSDRNAATNLLDRLNIPSAAQAPLVDEALKNAANMVAELRPAILSLAEMLVLKRMVRDRQIRRRYETHKQNEV